MHMAASRNCKGRMAMATAIDQFVDRLRDPEIINWMKEWSTQVVGHAWGIYYNERPEEGDYSDLEGDWLHSLDWSLQLHDAPPRDWRPSQHGCGGHYFLKKADEVLKQMSGFPVFTLDDLYFAIVRYLEAATVINEDTYDHFLDYIQHHVIMYREADMPICGIDGLPSEYDKFRESTNFGAALGYRAAIAKMLGEEPSLDDVVEDSDDELMPNEGVFNHIIEMDRDSSDFALRLERLELPQSIRSFHAMETNNPSGVLYGRFIARCSADVMESMDRRLRRLIPAIMRTAECAMKGRVVEGGGHPSFNIESIHSARDFLKHCLQHSFTVAKGKDSFHRRIANATALLAESDQQENEAVGTALSVAAIESMVGNKGSEPANAVPDRVATLLEPEPSQRGKAAGLAGKIYDIRSRALHGENIKAEKTYRAQARVLASAVVYAVWHRLTLLRRAGGDPENPADLIKELKDRKWDSHPDALPDLPAVRTLWRK